MNDKKSIPKKPGAFTTVLRVFSFQGERRKTFLAGYLLGCLALVTSLLLPELNRLLVELVSGEKRPDYIYGIAGIFLLLILLAPLTALGQYMQAKSVAWGTKQLRAAAFARLQGCDPAQGAGLRSGDILIRLTNDIQRAGGMFQSFAFYSLAKFLVISITGLIMLAAVNIYLACIAIVYSLLVLLLSSRLNPYVRKLDMQAREEVAASSDYLIEAVRNQLIVRIFLLKDILQTRYRQHCDIIRKKRTKYQCMNGLAYGILDVLTFSAPAIGFFLALWLGIANTRDYATVVYVATWFGLMGDAILSGATFVLLIQTNLVAAGRVFSMLDMPQEDLREEHMPLSHQAEEVITAESLCFSYGKGDAPILRDVRLSMTKGKNYAIVGSTGSGKSTLAKAIAGLLPIPAGTLRYTGIFAEALSLTQIRRLCAYVPQDNTLLPGNIYENIAYGNLAASRDQVIAAAKTAGVHDFIQHLPDGYETEIGENGNMLSGGQRQRLAIARAVLKHAPVLILDEATAALDSRTEEEILGALTMFTDPAVITVTVAHRLSTVRHADCIFVMEAGQIVERGTHQALLEKNGRYSQLWQHAINKNL